MWARPFAPESAGHCRSIDLSSTHYDPGDSGGLVGQRHAGDLCRFGLQQSGEPWLLRVILARHAYDGRGTDGEEAPKVPITLIGYTAEPFLAARAVRSWRQT